MLKYTILTLMMAAGLAACANSKAQNQTDKNLAGSSSTETVQTPVKPTPKKKSESNDNPVELSAEDIKNGSVKADDYDENSGAIKTEKSLCSVRAYVIDKDPNGLNVREDAEPNAKIIGKIPFKKDGVIVDIIQTNFMDKVKINHAEAVDDDYVSNQEGWVAANLLGVSTTGYDGKGVKLYEAGKGTKVLTVIPPETDVRVVSCDKDWVRVKYKNFTGWLDADSQCGNPVTNCS